MVATCLRAERRTGWTHHARRATWLPDHLLRRRSARHERTKLRRRPTSRRHRNATRSRKKKRQTPDSRHRRIQRTDGRGFRASRMDAVRRKARICHGSLLSPGPSVRRWAVREPPLQGLGVRISTARSCGIALLGTCRSRRPAPSPARRLARYRRDIWDREVV
jgi:hypothetical protein